VEGGRLTCSVTGISLRSFRAARSSLIRAPKGKLEAARRNKD
jgi:hypothetical protein